MFLLSDADTLFLQEKQKHFKRPLECHSLLDTEALPGFDDFEIYINIRTKLYSSDASDCYDNISKSIVSFPSHRPTTFPDICICSPFTGHEVAANRDDGLGGHAGTENRDRVLRDGLCECEFR